LTISHRPTLENYMTLSTFYVTVHAVQRLGYGMVDRNDRGSIAGGGSEAHPASYSVDTGGSFSRDKAAGA